MSRATFRVLPQTYNHEIAADRRRREVAKWSTVALFVVPGLAVFLVFILMPLVQSAFFSLYRWNGFGPLENYVGLENYQRLWGHTVFVDSVLHSFGIVALSLLIQLPLALALALMVGRGSLPGRRVFRLILFVPYIFSEILTAVIFDYVLHPHEGLMNTVLRTFVPNYQNIAWLGDRHLVLLSIFAVLTWKYLGFHMILYMAGLQNIPRDLEEAARVDGATDWQVLRRITLPLLGPTIRLTVFLSVLGSLQQFELVWVLTEGGPVNASELIGTYLYKFGIQRLNLGYGSAVAVSLFLITLLFSLGYQRMIMRQDYSYEML